MVTRSLSAKLALTAALIIAAACSDSTGPAAKFDPVKTDADLDALVDVTDAQSLQSFGVMSNYFQFVEPAVVSTSSARLLTSVRAPLTSASARQIAVQTASTLASKLFEAGSLRPSLEVLPPDQLGTTFVFDESTSSYVPSARTGAPANGVRFVLYAIDPVTEQPIVNTEIGYVDVIDTSAGSQTTAGLRLLVVSAGTTYLDYSFSASASISSAHLNVDGFMTNGTTRLDFEIGTTLTESQNQSLDLAVAFNFAIPSRNFSVDGAVHLTASGPTGSIEQDLTIKSGGASVRYDIQIDNTTVNATIFVNNRIFATITGDQDSPVVAGANGAELTNEEKATLIRLLGLADDAFDLFSGLLTPISDLGAPVPL